VGKGAVVLCGSLCHKHAVFWGKLLYKNSTLSEKSEMWGADYGTIEHLALPL
jgi:hypothetical protein